MSMDDMMGKTLGQYHLVELLGKGGMGAVYRAEQPALHRTVAVKILPVELARDENNNARFIREARTAAGLEHPHIVPIYDYGTQGDTPYVVMRYLPGGSLSMRMGRLARGANRISLQELSDLLLKLASALDYAHRKGVIHRDIKPSNIMFDEEDNPFLVDFGIAKVIRGNDNLTNLTGTGVALGTPTHMPPEQWRGESVVPATDQYSLAVVIYTLVSGRLPFEAPTPHGLMYKHLDTPPAPPHLERGDIPETISTVLSRALAKSPEDRFPSVMAFADTFQEAAHALPPEPPTFSLPERMATVTHERDKAPPPQSPPEPPSFSKGLPERMPTVTHERQQAAPTVQSATPPSHAMQQGIPAPQPQQSTPPPGGYYDYSSPGQATGPTYGQPAATQGGGMKWLWLALPVFAIFLIMGVVLVIVLSGGGDDDADNTAGDSPTVDNSALSLTPAEFMTPTLAPGSQGFIVRDSNYLAFSPGEVLAAQDDYIGLVLPHSSGGQGKLYLAPESRVMFQLPVDNRLLFTLYDNSEFFISTGAFSGAEMTLQTTPGLVVTVSGSCMAIDQSQGQLIAGCYSGNCSYVLPGQNRVTIPAGEQVLVQLNSGDTLINPISIFDAARSGDVVRRTGTGEDDINACILPIQENPVQPSATPRPTNTPLPQLSTPTTAPTLTSVAPADSDGDGVLDNSDACPAENGQGSPDGCPDSDGDEVPYNLDNCPTVAGSLFAGGCPDLDGDTVADANDACPDEAGLVENNGCPLPDADGDSVPDTEDNCPAEPGNFATGGCPDTDNDGVPDIDDACPAEFGDPETGCPVEE